MLGSPVRVWVVHVCRLDLLEDLERKHEELVRETMEMFEVEAFAESVEREKREWRREVEGKRGCR